MQNNGGGGRPFSFSSSFFLPLITKTTSPLILFFGGSLRPGASWNKTDVIVASGTPFARLPMLTVSSFSTICSHDSQLRFVTLIALP